MKITALAKLLKNMPQKQLALLDGSDGRQWVDIMGAAYPMDGMPRMDEMNVLAVLEVPIECRPDYEVRRGMVPEALLEDNQEDDQAAQMIAMTVAVNGQIVTPLYTPYGMMCIDDDMRKPVSDCKKTYEFYARKKGDRTYIVIKNGFQMIALLPTIKTWAQDNACGWLNDITRHALRTNSEMHRARPDDDRFTGFGGAE